ncbi:MAG TPA: poly(R)-hydroxyalkanoic acid synthase subunit PhaE [Candidatus Elarobacter sp.]|jgi:hypothetical protein
MADTPQKDPFAVWRELVAQWEKNVNSAANTAMASDEYSSSMHGALGMTMKMQETMRDLMAAYLANANLPSRSEVLALAERLGGIEARLDAMTALLERIAEAGGTKPDAPSRGPRPPRTKAPPSA